MKEKLNAIRERAKQELTAAVSREELDALRVKFLGKKGELTAILKQMGGLSAEERPKMGQLANEVRQSIEGMLGDKVQELKAKALQREIESTPVFDLSMPGQFGPRLLSPDHAGAARVRAHF